MNKIIPIALLFVAVLFLYTCSDDENESVKLGPTQTDFGVDTVYRALTDGFLVLRTNSNILGTVVGRVYCDFEPEPVTFLGSLYSNENVTYPIMEGSYWKVTKVHFDDPNISVRIIISWTPLE